MQKKLLKDVNGVEMRTGDIVEITGGYYKSDNGMFLITVSPKDTGWNGSYYGMERINKNGSISKAKYNNGSWPIQIYTNSRFKYFEAKNHNEQHAKIKVIKGIKKDGAIKRFNESLDELQGLHDYYKEQYTSECSLTKETAAKIDFIKNVIARLKAE